MPAYLHTPNGLLNPRFGLKNSHSKPYADRPESHSPCPASGSTLGCTHSWAKSRMRAGLQPGQLHKPKCPGTLTAASATHFLHRRALLVVLWFHPGDPDATGHRGAFPCHNPFSLDICLLCMLPLQCSTVSCPPPAFPSTLSCQSNSLYPAPSPFPPLPLSSSGASPLSSFLPAALPSSPTLLLHNLLLHS